MRSLVVLVTWLESNYVVSKIRSELSDLLDLIRGNLTPSSLKLQLAIVARVRIETVFFLDPKQGHKNLCVLMS